MEELDLDAIIVTTFDNVRYVTDCRPYFAASYYVNTYAAILSRDASPIAQGPVLEGAPMGLARPVSGWEGYPMVPVPTIASRWVSMIVDLLEQNSIRAGRIGIDDISFITYLEFEKMSTRYTIIPIFNEMIRVRAIKNEEEIKLLRHAAKIVDIGAEAGLEAMKVGMKEREIVAQMSKAMYAAGSEAEPWASSLSSGSRALSSVFSSEKSLRDGELATFDIGCIYEGYLGDIARTGGVGNVDHESKVVYTAAYESLLAGTKEIRPGVLSSRIDEKIRETLSAAGCTVPALSTGHGIGVGAPEIPWITPKTSGLEDFELKAGMVLCLEPRTARDHVAAAGCEDMILVTDGGHEVLTKCRKEEHLLLR